MALEEGKATDVSVYLRWVIPLVTKMLLDDINIVSVLPVDTKEWRQPLIDYLEHGKFPDDPRHRSEIRR
ncbi:hypothetical protein ACFXTN_012152 [Malus domestica]